ncbi:helix-turn-helix transcriptional regulator [Nocardia sp. NPDC019395]|uniref:helix-turn-helix domain-containing protein n=1 Tax=Nocardia sp. NPDC019395 TaxID=3154686 RepID=UPI0033D12461
MSETNSTLPRRQLGRYLREARESIGMTLVDVSALMEWSKSTLQRLETGQTDRIRTHDITLLGDIYRLTPEEIADLKALAEQASVKSWWQEYGAFISPNFDIYMGMESAAQELTFFHPSAIPGIIQTPAYSRSLDQLYFPKESDEQTCKRIEVRRRRQSVITRRMRPAKAAILLHESAVRTMVGSAKVMAAQLRQIADLSTQPNIELRLLSFRAGLPLGTPMGPFVILDFGSDRRGNSEPTVVYAQSFTGAFFFEKEVDVNRYRNGYEVTRSAALDVRPTRDLLREIAREYERGR